MADFLINVRSKWDASSIQAYAAEVEKAIRRIKSATDNARAAKGGAGRPASQKETSSILGEQARMEANISTLRSTKALPKAEIDKMARDNRAALKLQADAAGVTLLTGKRRIAAAQEVLALHSQANAADLAAAEQRLTASKKRARSAKPTLEAPNAEEQAQRDAAKARAAQPKAPSQTALREKRIADDRAAKLEEQERARKRFGLPDFDPALSIRERQKVISPHLRAVEREEDRQAGKKGGLKGDVGFNRSVLADDDGLRELTREYARTQTKINAIKAREAEVVLQHLRLSQESVRLTAKELVSRANYRGNVAKLLSGSPKDVESLGTAARRQANLRNQTQGVEASQVLGSNEDIKLRADTTRSRRRIKALVDQEVNAEARVVKELGQEAAFFNARSRGTDARVDRAVDKAGKAIQTDRNREAAAQRRIADARTRQAVTDEKAARDSQALQARRNAPASLFQRAEARLRPGAPASERPTAGQALGGGILSAARFGAGAAILYGTLNTIKEMVTEASELERVFGLVESQFAATDKSAEFPGFREEIIAISKETGQMATEVAFVGFQFQGAFGDKPGGAAYALAQTRAAIEIARVSGLALGELVDSLTASSLAFNVSIADVSDKALGIQARFGVQAKETLQFFGDLSSVAGEAGLNLNQLGAIAGAAQQATGRSGAALAEGLGRIIPGIQEASVSLVRFYQQTPGLSGKAPEIAAAAGAGQTGAVLERLIRDYGQLDAAQRKQIITLLGGRREAQVLIPILENSAKVVQELDGAYTGLIDDTGKTEEAFAKLQETLSQKVAQLQRSFEAFGQELFEAGLGDLLKDLAVAGEALIKVISAMASAMAFINRETHGAAIKVLELIVALKLLRALGALGVGGFGFKQGLRGIGAQAGSEAAIAAGGRLQAGRAGFSSARAAGGGIRAGANAGLAAAGLGYASLGAGAALIVGTEYFKERGNVQGQANALADKIRKADSAALKEIVKDKADFWTRVAIRGSGKELPAEMAAKELYIRGGAANRGDLTAAKDAGLLKALEGRFKGLDQKSIDELLKADAEGSDPTSAPAIARVLQLIRQEPGGNAALQAAVQKFAANAVTATAASRVASGETIQSVAAAKSALDAGAISSTEYMQTLDRELAAYRSMLANGGKLIEKDAANYIAIQKQQSEYVSGKARELVDYQLGLNELAGLGGPGAEVSALTTLLQDKTVTDPKVRLKAANDLIAAEKKIQDVQLAAAETAAERLRILNAGFVVPDESRIAVLEAAITDTDVAFRALVDAGSHAFGNAANLITLIATGAVELGITSMAAYKTLVTKKMAELQSISTGEGGTFAADEADINQEYNRLQTLLDKLNNSSLSGPGVPGAKGKASPEDLAAARVAAKKEAEADAKAIADEAKANAEARFALMRAESVGDPIRLAEIAIEQAKDMGARAKTTAEILNAKTAMIEAQRGLADARSSVADAYRNIDKALADAAGDSVRSAQIELESIRTHLEEAKARGDKIGAVQLEAQLIAQQRTVDQESLSSAQQDIDFYREMGQATLGQTIASYEALLPLASKNKDDYQALLLKIRALRKEGDAQTAFNIPSEIKLPTLYEVRRANQSAAAGQSYQDARVITINFTANNTADAEGIANQIVDQFSGPSRFGALPRRY